VKAESGSRRRGARNPNNLDAVGQVWGERETWEGCSGSRFSPGLIAAVVVATAAAGPAPCKRGVSSVGPVVLTNGHLDRQRSELTPHTENCLRK
jgi:hypothetical protein